MEYDKDFQEWVKAMELNAELIEKEYFERNENIKKMEKEIELLKSYIKEYKKQ